MPIAAPKCGAERTRGVRAHTGDRRFKRDICCDQESCKVPRIRCQDFVVGCDQDCDHKRKRDGQFGEKGGEIAVNARQRRGVATALWAGAPCSASAASATPATAPSNCPRSRTPHPTRQLCPN